MHSAPLPESKPVGRIIPFLADQSLTGTYCGSIGQQPANENSPGVLATHSSLTEHIFIKTRGKRQKVYFDDIVWIESERNYVSIFTETDQITTLMPISTLAQYMPPALFIRVHKSFIVALRKVDYALKNQLGLKRQSEVKLIPLGGQFKKNLLTVIEQRMARK